MTSNIFKSDTKNDTVKNIFEDMITTSSLTIDPFAYGGYTLSYDHNGMQVTAKATTEPKKPEVSEDVKTIMKPEGKRIKIKHYDKGFYQYTKDLMPDIVNVTVYNNRVVAVDFADGTREKAVLDPSDTYINEQNFTEQGISICIAKKLAGGSSIYNKLIDYALRVMKKNEKAKAKAEAEEKARKEKAKKLAKKKEKRRATKKEEQIKIMAEALKRAK